MNAVSDYSPIIAARGRLKSLASALGASPRLRSATALAATLLLLACPSSQEDSDPVDTSTVQQRVADVDGFIVGRIVDGPLTEPGPLGAFNPRTGELVRSTVMVASGDPPVAVSPRQDQLLVALSDDTVALVDIKADGRLEIDERFEAPDAVQGGFGFNALGDRALIGGKWVTLRTLTGPIIGEPSSLMSPDGVHHLGPAGLYRDHELVWPTRGRSVFSPDGQWLLTGGAPQDGYGFSVPSSLRILHVPTQAAVVGLFEGAVGDAQPWFAGWLEPHPENLVPALAAGVLGDIGKSVPLEREVEAPRFVDLAGTVDSGVLTTAFEWTLGDRTVLEWDWPDNTQRWNLMGFSHGGRYGWYEFAEFFPVTVGVTSGPVPTAVQVRVLTEVIHRRFDLHDPSAPAHDFVSAPTGSVGSLSGWEVSTTETNCGGNARTNEPGYPRAPFWSASFDGVAGVRNYNTNLPTFSALAGGAIACTVRRGGQWNVWDVDDGFTLEQFGHMWSADRRWANVNSHSGSSDPTARPICFRDIAARDPTRYCQNIDAVSGAGNTFQPIAWAGGHRSAPGREGEPATLTYLNKLAASPGDEVHLFGVRFGDSGTVRIGDVAVPAAEIVSWEDDRVVFTMPAGVERGRVLVEGPNGADVGGPHYYLVPTTRWEPPHTAPVAPEVAYPGRVSVTADITATDWQVQLGTDPAGDHSLPTPAEVIQTDTGFDVFVPARPPLGPGFIHLRQGHLVRSAPIHILSEIKTSPDAWLTLIDVPGIFNAGDHGSDFLRIADQTISPLYDVAIGPAHDGFLTGLSTGAGCAGCSVDPVPKNTATNGVGAAWFFGGTDLLPLTGFETIETSYRPVWGPTVTPDFGGLALSALGVDQDGALFAVATDSAPTVRAYTSPDGATFSLLGELPDSAVVGGPLHHVRATDGSIDAFLPAGGVRLIHRDLTVDVLPAPPLRSILSTVNGLVFAHEPADHSLYVLDLYQDTPAWQEVTDLALQGRALAIAVDVGKHRLYVLRADGQVFRSEWGTIGGLAPVGEPVSLHDVAGDHRSGLVTVIPGTPYDALAVMVAREDRSEVWFVMEVN